METKMDGGTDAWEKLEIKSEPMLVNTKEVILLCIQSHFVIIKKMPTFFVRFQAPTANKMSTEQKALWHVYSNRLYLHLSAWHIRLQQRVLPYTQLSGTTSKLQIPSHLPALQIIHRIVVVLFNRLRRLLLHHRRSLTFLPLKTCWPSCFHSRTICMNTSAH